MYFNFNTNTPAEPYSGIDAEWVKFTDNLNNGVEARSDNAKANDSVLSGMRPLLIA